MRERGGRQTETDGYRGCKERVKFATPLLALPDYGCLNPSRYTGFWKQFFGLICFYEDSPSPLLF